MRADLVFSARIYLDAEQAIRRIFVDNLVVRNRLLTRRVVRNVGDIVYVFFKIGDYRFGFFRKNTFFLSNKQIIKEKSLL